MNFLCVQKECCGNRSHNIYNKLESLMKCIKDHRQIESFREHRVEIIKLLDSIINDNNYHIFSDLFIIHAFLRSYSLCMKDDDMSWTYLIRILKNYDTKDINRIIYFYTAIPIFYLNNNKLDDGPSPDYFYTDWNFNYRMMFQELLKYDSNNKRLLEMVENRQMEIELTYYHTKRPQWLSMSIGLSVIASYCMVTKDYDGYYQMVENLFSNSDEFHNKMVLNGINEKIDENKYVGNHDKVEDYIKYVLDLVKEKENNRAIH